MPGPLVRTTASATHAAPAAASAPGTAGPAGSPVRGRASRFAAAGLGASCMAAGAAERRQGCRCRTRSR
ncbi:hypothetical protein HMPREF1868_01003 [Olsenella sp. DNF00959]|nr:hypothetical protein HMPREF1868_01003 [Olsenella sp. DNF00959]